MTGLTPTDEPRPEREWDELSPPWDGSALPPPYPPPADPRTPLCRHNWPSDWRPQKGERQLHCKRCDRWIWAHEWEVVQ